jgi:RNA polymerase sigma factor (sigma-70 family)
MRASATRRRKMENHLTDRRAEFNALYDAHYAAVRAYAWRRDPGFADDVVAETFLVAWKRLGDIPAGAALPWLLAVARNTHLNTRRGERRRQERELTDAAAWPQAETSPQPTGADESDGRVVRLLRRLPESDREVLLLVAWENLDREAVARVLGCSRANVALRLHRARRRFHALLAEAGPEALGTSQEPAPPHRNPRVLTQGAQHD